MNIEQENQNNKETIEKLDELIQKKKEEVAGLQRLLSSIENQTSGESVEPLATDEMDNTNKHNT